MRLASCLAALLMTGCATQQTPTSFPTEVLEPHTVKKPDIRGEPLAMMPAAPLVWIQFDGHKVRQWATWKALDDVLVRYASEPMQAIEREVGVDLVHAADTFAFALYAPPGARNAARSAESTGWPFLFVRGGFRVSAMLDAARARASAEDPLTEIEEEGVKLYRTHRRVYLPVGDDVAFVFEPALTRRVLHVLSGAEQNSALNDTRYETLWTQIDGRSGDVQLAADLDQLRSVGALPKVNLGVSESSLNLLIARMEAPSNVSIAMVAVARDEPAAANLEATLDRFRQTMMSTLGGWPFSLGRLIQQGITIVHEDTVVRLRINARAEEIERLISALNMAAAFGGP